MRTLRFALTVLLAMIAAAAPGKAAAHLYVLLVLDPGVGADVEKDRSHVEAILRGGIDEQYMSITPLDKEKANKATVLKYFSALSPAKEDSIFCFVSCHGGTDERSKEHVLQLTGSGRPEIVKRSELRDALRATGAGLTILISDACSDYLKLPERQDTRITFKAPGKTTILPAYRRLFFDARGIVDINATYEGAFAFSDDEEGGLFTRALYQYFEDPDVRKDPRTSWPQACIAVQLKTEEGFGTWKQRVIDQLTKKNLWDPDKIEDHRLLNEQKLQTPQVFFAPGVRLGLRAQGTKGNGVKVIDLTLDSPARAAGIRKGDVIIGVDGQNIEGSDDWDRIMDPALAAGKASFKFKVVRATGEIEDVSVSMMPR